MYNTSANMSFPHLSKSITNGPPELQQGSCRDGSGSLQQTPIVGDDSFLPPRVPTPSPMASCRHLPPHQMETPTRPVLPWCYGDGTVSNSSRRDGVDDISRIVTHLPDGSSRRLLVNSQSLWLHCNLLPHTSPCKSWNKVARRSRVSGTGCWL